MLIRFKGDRNKIINYTKLGRLIPNDLTEIDITSFFDTQTRTEKEIVAILKADPNIELVDVSPILENKIAKEIEEKKTEVIADHVQDGISDNLSTFSGKKKRGFK